VILAASRFPPRDLSQNVTGSLHGTLSLASRKTVACAPRLGQELRCEVELTKVYTRGQDWWSLGYEATGPADLLPSELEATTAPVFAQALPGGVETAPDESTSCAVAGPAAPHRL
jgi:hypothetical protein